MKKRKWSRMLSLLLTAVMAVVVFTGCGEKTETKTDAV